MSLTTQRVQHELCFTGWNWYKDYVTHYLEPSVAEF